ncbi:SDR family NAD(P)-dependent oxidoreductase [Ruminiclostridium cellulolyticum]|uniref:Short-chain dehydrogenase/reductase SDR n=1 Tax=Ruminiclostridium cellulolyticum (strain ATCC 35319 / DSM 5812 / JCM 6584 / H10) TaxID=394503 RepID=B8I0J6_RUMCH|nr:SDR family oxidoreductase [Ruminiclostridium cellulolyticum]ACL75571.1 short-chain dehydrogenase/reductase SDR [Ruminiclostridium cellulolyticum H10]
MINPIDLSGKNILVTGASSGIGKGIAIYLSKVGANIIMAARNEEKLKETYNELEPGNHSYYLIDLNNLDEIEGMIDNICSDGRKLNGIVHSAGISSTIPIQYIKLDNLKSIMSINFYSFIELVKHFSKRKYNDNGGSIVAISSISSKVGARGLAAYCASKGALDSSIRPIALELAAKNIRINSIAPGMIKSQIYDGLIELVNNNNFETDLKKRQIMGLGKPEDVASAAAFLLSDASKFITGTSIIVDGGYLAH